MFKKISVIELQKIKDSVASRYNLEIPTYTISLPGGKHQAIKHDEESIADKNTPQAEKDEWSAYQKQSLLMQSEMNEKSTAYAFYEGIECEVEQDWLDKQKWLEIELPDNKFDLKVMYVTTELLKTPQDIKNAMFEIMKISMQGVDNSVIEAAENMFRSSL